MTFLVLLLTSVLQTSIEAARAPVPASATTTSASGISVRITSPLGRSGAHGKIRIVAQVRSDDAAPVQPVRFLIDQQLFKTDSDGPPYVVEWEDENPFERREITVEVTDGHGRAATDRVVLEPFDIVEESQVTSVLLEVAVQDQAGRFVKGIELGALLAAGRRRAAEAGSGPTGRGRRDVLTARRREREHVAANGLRPADGGDPRRLHVAARSHGHRALRQVAAGGDRPDRRSPDHSRGHRRHPPRRRHGDIELAGRDVEPARHPPRGGGRSC